MSHKPVIAVDGPAASGKGTLARTLSQKLGFAYLDTGALYRATAHELLSSGLSIKDKKDAIKAAKHLSTKVQNAANPHDILNHPALRQDKTGQAAAKIASIPEVRAALKELQQNFAKKPGIQYKGAVLDGRDIGTIICPNAELKLYITADTEVRAKRRLKELQSKGINVTYSTVLDDMMERDARDTGRDIAPLRPAEDSITIDTSDLNADEVFEKAYEIAVQRLNLKL